MTSPIGLSVLIVDDNEIIRSLLRIIIQGTDYTVVGEAGTAQIAKERVLALRPDVICLDLMMPDSDNLDLLDWIVVNLPNCIVLIISGRHDRETVETVLRHGAKGFIVKPFNPGTVLDTLRMATRKYRNAKP